MNTTMQRTKSNVSFALFFYFLPLQIFLILTSVLVTSWGKKIIALHSDFLHVAVYSVTQKHFNENNAPDMQNTSIKKQKCWNFAQGKELKASLRPGHVKTASSNWSTRTNSNALWPQSSAPLTPSHCSLTWTGDTLQRQTWHFDL